MSSNTVKDRSGLGLPSKAERRALGKAAAQRRAKQRHRRELRNRILRVAAPIVVVGAIVGAIILFSGGHDSSTTPTAGSSTPAAQDTPWVLPSGLDPQLGTEPQVSAGEGTLTDLKLTTIVQGTGAPVASGDYISVNYVGAYYASGQIFDASWTGPTAAAPVEFAVGVGQLIQGWDQGLIGVPVGSRVQLDVPFALAYKDDPSQPQGDLRFVVDILEDAGTS
ncbi:MAG TPA: FKBP-type peptidyl-prolyl cis-trans isomerase [Micromonosporaceae bacterium]|jgi:peptidylprolyl isomerase